MCEVTVARSLFGLSPEGRLGTDGQDVASRADPKQYVYDVNSDEQAVPYLERYLSLIFQQAGVRRINIIAHSRGNDLLLRALSLMSIANSLPAQCCGELIMASPDVDRDYARNTVPTVLPYFERTTLYVNDKDRALWVSKSLAGGIPRLGELQENRIPIILSGMDSIDATAAQQPFFDFDHDEYVDNAVLLGDIEHLVDMEYAPPDQRTPLFLVRYFQAAKYWKLKP